MVLPGEARWPRKAEQLMPRQENGSVGERTWHRLSFEQLLGSGSSAFSSGLYIVVTVAAALAALRYVW